MSYRTKLFMMLQRAYPILRGHFAPAYLVGSNMLRAYLFFIYESTTHRDNIHEDFRGWEHKI